MLGDNFVASLALLIKILYMERSYDIFEVLPDGTQVWRVAVSGHDAALAEMRELASKSVNEFRMMHLGTNSVAAILYAKQSPSSFSPNETKEPKRDDGKTKLSMRRRVINRRILPVGYSSGLLSFRSNQGRT